MNKRMIAIALSVLMCSALFGCTPKEHEEPPKATTDPGNQIRETYLNEVGTITPLKAYPSGSKVQLSPKLSPLYVDANNVFALKMVKALGNDWTGVFSPISIQIALEMLSNGGDEAACSALLNAVCPGLTRDDVNSNANKMISYLVKASGVSFNTAVVVNNDLRLSQKFANAAADYYSSAVGALDFSDPSAALNEINTWVKDNTNGIIERLLSENEIGADTAVVLLNALTMDLKWEDKFYALRELITFYGSKGEGSAPAVASSGMFGYGEYENGCMVTLPYQNGEFAMAVILPDKGVSPAEAIETMMTKVGECSVSNVVIKMPKLELDSRIDVLSMSKELSLFDALNGNFSELVAGESPIISAVLQQNHICVNEQGTTAVSAAAVVATKGAPVFGGDHTVVCDRPYAMLIYHVETGTVMYVSIVNDI